MQVDPEPRPGQLPAAIALVDMDDLRAVHAAILPQHDHDHDHSRGRGRGRERISDRSSIDHRNRIAPGRKYAAVMIDDDQVMVLAGRCEQGYTWEVEAGGPDENFLTMMSVFHDGRRVHRGGMAGPKLYPGSVINEYRGRKDALPYVIVARTAPQVDRVVVTTDRGAEIELPLSEIIDQFGLRFAAAVLPDGHGPGSIRAEAHGLTLQTQQQPMPRRPSGGSGG